LLRIKTLQGLMGDVSAHTPRHVRLGAAIRELAVEYGTLIDAKRGISRPSLHR
jgi:hypothetical protein